MVREASEALLQTRLYTTFFFLYGALVGAEVMGKGPRHLFFSCLGGTQHLKSADARDNKGSQPELLCH